MVLRESECNSSYGCWVAFPLDANAPLKFPDGGVLSVGVTTGRNWHARTPKSQLLNLLFLALPRFKSNIVFRYIS
jgi:hypothetical protein